MEKIGRIILLGVIVGLVISALGTVSNLVWRPWAAGVPQLRDVQFQYVLIGFFLDLVTGFLYVVAFSVIRRGREGHFTRLLLTFWALLLLLGTLPRAASLYRAFALPEKLVLAWAATWAVEAFIVALLITLLYPKVKGPGDAGSPAKE